ncbi:helix-turn-helix domain-containing protein [Sporomusa acidovorans]|uniref:HTH cro/C1-type domain-containing protein n=1 Tax=Sporomusa acidovorans (strain ATCC 49682 / DSM 3132 / Mol) TaxID=1123286 RepID=A0ABZ3J6A7_SPOA4|nr:helix-turn-helix transcriptional regulator [Sporomusa acidovorans]OZC23843.1 HTH-type transcriptional regulator SinR [Sporomusa acidovorans DSM 3132]SDF81315.1 Helix-turn-helix [Sporomusa acidovorans]
MIDKIFGQILKKLRTEKGLSQEEFAANVGLHRTYISQLERGLKSPSLGVMAKISSELGITLVQLMTELEKNQN